MTPSERGLRSLLLLGTDTAAGKTTVAEGLLRLCQRRGLRVAPYKPAQSGEEAGGPESDASRLLRAAGLPRVYLPEMVPYSLSQPLSLSLAARLDSRVISESYMVQGALRLLRGHQAILLETAGGVLSPYGPSSTPLSLAQNLSRRIAIDILLVGENRLGAINHCALAALALTVAGLSCAGIVLVDTGPPRSAAENFNPLEIASATNLPVLGRLRHLVGPLITADAIADALSTDIDLGRFFSGGLVAPSAQSA